MDNFSQGCILLSRSIFESDIFKKPSDRLKVWLYIVGNVNHKDNGLPRGSKYFKYERIQQNTHVKYNIIVKSIKRMKESNMLDVQKATHGCVVTVLNYNEYQDIEKYRGKTKATQKQHKGNTEATQSPQYIQEGKEGNNDKNEISNTGEKNLSTGKPDKSNPEINDLIKQIKQTCSALGIVYDNDQDRNFAKHILTAKQFGEFADKLGKTRCQVAIGVLKASVQIDYFKGYASGPRKIYDNYAEIYNKRQQKEKKQSEPLYSPTL